MNYSRRKNTSLNLLTFHLTKYVEWIVVFYIHDNCPTFLLFILLICHNYFMCCSLDGLVSSLNALRIVMPHLFFPPQKKFSSRGIMNDHMKSSWPNLEQNFFLEGYNMGWSSYPVNFKKSSYNIFFAFSSDKMLLNYNLKIHLNASSWTCTCTDTCILSSSFHFLFFPLLFWWVQADKILEQLLGFISTFDLLGLKNYWDHLERRIFSHLEYTHAHNVNKLRISVLR